MITNKELDEVELSPTKKDYYQIWNELMELASKISERWSPASTNESDPGIVLLKCLTACADMLNYNIDINTLETMLTSATQRESMMELTSRLGYDMKYYQGATCKVTISYKPSNDTSMADLGGSIYFPKFVNLKNEDEDVNYVTLEEFTLDDTEARTISAIEGALVECESDNDNIISLIHLDDNNRYYFQEAAVAENGVFITNISDGDESTEWKKVDNLNTQLIGSKVYKFGYDSKNHTPYIQFPDDISELISDGLRIKYIRTNGYAGNIAANTLSKLEPAAIWSTSDNDNIAGLDTDYFNITNITAAKNGADPESLASAYNNFKKTVGTFDTLVTCRDYMNKIYELTVSQTDTTPLVSNCIVSDIRDDINNAITLCSFDEYGICYSTKSLKTGTENAINQFDLILYPFSTIHGLNTKAEYKNSFNYDASNFYSIVSELDDYKTIAHNIKLPSNNSGGLPDIVAIKNYLQLNATITTNKRVNSVEETEILNNIYTAIYKNFNARNVDFGEEIAEELIQEAIEEADSRIKDVRITANTLVTKLRDYSGAEYELVAYGNTTSYEHADQLYNKLALRNILAGKIAMFDYDESFETSYDESSYPDYNSTYPADTEDEHAINRISTQFQLATKTSKGYVPFTGTSGYTLTTNEIIQFRLPNFKTTYTYPAYVNYFVHLEQTASKIAIPATMQTVSGYLDSELSSDGSTYPRWNALVATGTPSAHMTQITVSATTYSSVLAQYGRVFVLSNNIYTSLVNQPENFTQTFYVFNVEKGFGTLYAYFHNQSPAIILYRSLGVNTSKASSYGKLVDNNYVRYIECYSYQTSTAPIKNIYVPITYSETTSEHTADGLGQDAVYNGLVANSDYLLKAGEYLLINYTDSTTDSSGTETKTVKNVIYTGGDTNNPVFIKANFELVDSEKYHSSHSYSKTTGYEFTDHADLEGMFTLGSDEQICIRELVKVKLNNKVSNIYWERQDDVTDASVNTFTFKDHYVLPEWTEGQEYTEDKTSEDYNNAYTLKTGEYFYYADSKKTGMAYYGAGTTIIKTMNTPVLKKYAATGNADNETILENGIESVPWEAFNLNGEYAYLTIIENQYITLTEGDTIKGITTGTSTTKPSTFDVILDNTWKTINAATYQFATDDTESYLPSAPSTGITWQVRSRLNINIGPTTVQELNKYDSLTLWHVPYTNSTAGKPTEVITLTPTATDSSGNIIPLKVRCNYPFEASADTLDLVYTEDDEVVANIGAKFLLSEENPITITYTTSDSVSNTNILTTNNYSDNWTKLSYASFKTVASGSDISFDLRVNIGENAKQSERCGLIMFYYIDKNASDTNYITLSSSNADGPMAGVRLYNHYTNSKQDAYATSYKLKTGINVVEVKGTCTKITVKSCAADSHTDTIVFSDLRIVKDINAKLNYHYNSQSFDSALQQLCADIRSLSIADNFYYNTIIDSTSDIDLNALITTDTLASPETWYDNNNVNSNFVITEIDADYLSTGITLSKASKL